MGNDLIVNSEFAQDAHSTGLHEKAGTNGTAFVRLLENFNLMSGSFQKTAVDEPAAPQPMTATRML